MHGRLERGNSFGHPDEASGYEGLLPRSELSGVDLLQSAAFLAPQLAALLGRHARESGLAARLADEAGFDLSTAQYTGKLLGQKKLASSLHSYLNEDHYNCSCHANPHKLTQPSLIYDLGFD